MHDAGSSHGKKTAAANKSAANASSSANKGNEPLGKNLYRVKSGDTLYGIVWMYGQDFQTVVKRNGLTPPYAIYAGQILKLDLEAKKSGRYIVKRGDMLSAIARDNNVSMDTIGRLNNLKKPYVIHPGQTLILGTPQNNAAAQTASNGSSSGSAADGQEKRDSAQTVTQKPDRAEKQALAAGKGKEYSRAENAQINNNKLTWQWPSRGRIVQGFSLSEMGNKGIDIAGTRGQAVIAAASGKVVYAGSALRGYGNLIIIKHNDDYLSAYAHNDVLRVKEQQEVKAGQRIADMGSSDAQDVRLHFEIRYRGQSVNPLRFLPKR